MKLKFLTLIVLFNFSLIFSQNDKTVTLTVSAQGQTISEAKQNALRDAIEQAFGTFISSNTEIFNDELVKDEIVSVSNGNIQDYEVISEVELPNGSYATILKATVSLTKLASFVESKGGEVEFKGGILAANVKQQILNEKNEIKAIKNIIDVSKEILIKSFDYKIVSGQPKQGNNNDNWLLPLQIDIKFNENIENFKEYLFNSLQSLSMSETEIDKYNSLGKKTFPIGLGNGEEFAGFLPIFTEDRIKAKNFTKQYFDSIRQKNPSKNLKYQIYFKIPNLREFWSKKGKLNQLKQRVFLNLDDLIRGIESAPLHNLGIIYFEESLNPILNFRTKTTRNSIVELILSIKEIILNFKITNGVNIIDREYFDKKFDLIEGYARTDSPLIVWPPRFRSLDYDKIDDNTSKLYKTFTPFLNWELIRAGFWPTKYHYKPKWPGYSFNSIHHSGYTSLRSRNWLRTSYYNFLNSKFGFIAAIEMIISQQNEKNNQYVEPKHGQRIEDKPNLAVISFQDFSYTNNKILSLLYVDKLNLSELEKVENYKIYPTHKYLQSTQKSTKQKTQVSKESIIFKPTHYVSDPDGWTNFRDAPRGKILNRINNKTECKVLHNENGWMSVELENGNKGYIHSSRLKLIN